MFKQLLTRPLAVPVDLSIPVDIRLLQAFAPTCPPQGANRADASAWGAQAFSAAWVAFSKISQRKPQRVDGASYHVSNGRRSGRPTRFKNISRRCSVMKEMVGRMTALPIRALRPLSTTTRGPHARLI